jgi:hypothetical protein
MTSKFYAYTDNSRKQATPLTIRGDLLGALNPRHLRHESGIYVVNMLFIPAFARN